MNPRTALTRFTRRRPGPPRTPEPGAVLLSARGLGLRVGGTWLLRDVDLDLAAGTLLAVVGPNGAGKSTLLSLLAGDRPPTTGTVHVDGLPTVGTRPADLARRRAVLPQRPLLSFPFTVADVVAMGRAPWAGTDAEDDDEDAVAGALTATGMTGFAHRRYPTLSGGEQARASFARVLAQHTPVLLLDEPTAALDLRHQEQLMRTARERADAGHAVLAVLHDLQLAAAYADEIAVLHDGRLVERGEPATVLTEPLLEEVYQLPVEVLRHPVTGAVLVGPRRNGKGTPSS
ncbi:heme ABC transporter ATP-binding protein [Streptomyces sp. NPDC003656]|uniref:heme ABC transporter ATP-binding protein n=1 Tax=Streptomyces sp. DSM 110735 TaxID=2775031 RepID=UPI0018F494EE|nr:heme ABC transporter ATP-binding protein [Streptomyces sp. DSM 110735]MBJ7905606.1 heme ABC transporter ATP-binding protein [Streptomyces sp. DSM 110735]